MLALVYVAIQFVGMSLYGIETWNRYGDGFGAYFGLIARMSPLRWARAGLFVRKPLSGPTNLDMVPGTVALVCVVIGTSSATVDYTWVSATTIWYVEVGALVIGHVAGLVLAHERALVSFESDTQVATRSQCWMLVVMIAFSSLGLWLLSAANS